MDKRFLRTHEARKIYEEIKDLPIVDYHCHLNPKDIADDYAYENIGELWLSHDHYKWRAMRICGVDEKYITGDASWQEKFMKYAEIMPKLAGNSLYYWSHLELEKLFGITEHMSKDTAEKIWNECEKHKDELTARQIIKRFPVKFVATTDDPVDSLEYHGEYEGILFTPTFRPDKAFELNDEYYSKLSEVSQVEVKDVDSLIQALEKRLEFFISQGCKISDQCFSVTPILADYSRAQSIFEKRNEGVSEQEIREFKGYVFSRLAEIYAKNSIIMQVHLNVKRNINKKMFESVGVDSGFDIAGSELYPHCLTEIFSFLDYNGNLPKTVIYSLNPYDERMLFQVAGSFRNVKVGAPWWHNDSYSGIRGHFENASEYSALGCDLGMLTDSRNLAGYVRFDFYRRMLADYLGELVSEDKLDLNCALDIAKDIAYGNVVEFLNLKF